MSLCTATSAFFDAIVTTVARRNLTDILGNIAGASWLNVVYTSTTALVAVAALLTFRRLLSDVATSAKQFVQVTFHSVFFQVFLWTGYAVLGACQ
jgi:hypothetical protein